ncbi:hypothetical protein ACTWPT_56180 [Nonomuraea sp. 3N208]|uniref:hypothetical protein n=1 Tax=Nonomuraea sp. 3N208 TaxID=3457421 RepID=UPI003FCFD518
MRQLNGLPPEILLIPLAGHSRGHSGVAVDTGATWLLHAGDAYFFRDRRHAKPFCHVTITIPEGAPGVFGPLAERGRDKLVKRVTVAVLAAMESFGAVSST